MTTQPVPDENVALDWALDYWRMGLCPIPLRERHTPEECRGDKRDRDDDGQPLAHECPAPHGRGSKRPAVEWLAFQHRRPTEEEIVGWWGAHPEWGVGIVCGRISGSPGLSLVCLDFDNPAGFEKLLGGPDGMIGASTMVQQTKRGYHVLLLADGVVPKHKIPELSCDVQAEASYLAVHPTLHPMTAQRYRWLRPGNGIYAIGDFGEFLATHGYTPPPTPEKVGITLLGESWLTRLLTEVIGEGGRHEAAKAYAGYLVARNPQDVALAMLMDWNADHCDPPLPAAEIERLVTDFALKEQEKAAAESEDTAMEGLGAFLARRRTALVERFTQPHRTRGLLTSFEGLNKAIGGFEAGLCYLLAARPGNYKTALGFEWALDVARDGHVVAAISLEQGKEAIVTRWLQPYVEANIWQLRRDGKGIAEQSRQYRELLAGIEELSTLPLYLDSTPGLSVKRIEQRLVALEQSLARPVEFLVVDYINLLEPDDEDAGSLYQQVTKFIVRLAGLAKRKAIPILVLAQLNREAERDDEPQLAHLRDSGHLEQRADVILMVKRDPRGERVMQGGVTPPDTMSLFVRKVKDGPADDKIRIKVVGAGRRLVELNE